MTGLPSDSVDASVLVFSPSLNDVEHLQGIVVAIRAVLPDCEILLIDDGSDEPISFAWADARTLHVRLPDNFGIGVCTHVALDYALANDHQIVVRVDADGQHPIEEIPALITHIQRGEADIVVGSRVNRSFEPGMASFAKHMVRIYFTQVAKWMTGGRAPTDVNTGFIALSRSAVATLNKFEFDRYPEPQILVLGCRKKLRVMEVPIQQNERMSGASSVTLVQALRLLYRFNLFVLYEILRGRGR